MTGPGSAAPGPVFFGASVAGWSEAERVALAATARLPLRDGYAEFVARTGSQRSLNAYEVQRRRLLAVEQPELPATPVGELSAGYVGLSIGYFDLETTYSTQPRLLCGAIVDGFGRLRSFTLEEYPGVSWLDDGPLAVAIARALESYDVVVSWNGKLFDVPVLNGRLAVAGERPVSLRLHVDAMYLASGSSMRVGRRSLESVSRFFGVASRKTPLDVGTWDRADHGSVEDYRRIVEHCEADVLVLREVFGHLKRNVVRIHR